MTRWKNLLLICILPLATGTLCAPLCGQPAWSSCGQLLSESNEVRQELELTPEQLNELGRAMAVLEESRDKEMAKLKELATRVQRDGTKDERAEMDRIRKRVAVEMPREFEKRCEELLLDFQWKRLRQIRLRQAGTWALTLPDVQQELEMTNEQIGKLPSARRDVLDKTDQLKTQAWQRAIDGGIRKPYVSQIWNALNSPRRLDYVLDNLTDEEVERIEALKDDYTEFTKQAKALELSMYDILTGLQRKTLEKMRGAALDR